MKTAILSFQAVWGLFSVTLYRRVQSEMVLIRFWNLRKLYKRSETGNQRSSKVQRRSETLKTCWTVWKLITSSAAQPFLSLNLFRLKHGDHRISAEPEEPAAQSPENPGEQNDLDAGNTEEVGPTGRTDGRQPACCTKALQLFPGCPLTFPDWMNGGQSSTAGLSETWQLWFVNRLSAANRLKELSVSQHKVRIDNWNIWFGPVQKFLIDSVSKDW